MQKKIVIDLHIWNRAVINTENPDYEIAKKVLIEKIRESIWLKIKSLTKDDIDKLPVEITDWPL